jgi:hypothetical protein
MGMAVLIAACDSPSGLTPSSPGAPTPAVTGSALAKAPCSVLTAADARAALGEDIDGGRSLNVAGQPSCSYAGTGNDIGSTVSVTFTDATQYHSNHDHAPSLGFLIEDGVAGMGEEAYYQMPAQTDTGPVLLFVHRKEVYFWVSVDRSGLNRQDARAAERKLAATILQKV